MENINSTDPKGRIKNIAVFASGAGSNTKKIIEYFSSPPGNSVQKPVKIALVVSNNPSAGVLQIAKQENIPSLIIERRKFYEDGYADELKKNKIDLIVLAGFLWKLPSVLIAAYSNKIINVHPALLPKFGGKGMYGNYVHETVINSKEKQSGISIHYVDEIYDHGKIIFQAHCNVDENETPESLAIKIHALEHQHYPRVIEEIISVVD